jgi:hypothetical protein
VDDSFAHFEFERFRQEFKIRVQRRRLGVDITQDAARVIFRDDPALYSEYVAWRSRTGRAPLLVTAPAPSLPSPVAATRGCPWARARGR